MNRNCAFIAAGLDDGAGVGLAKRSIGPDQSDRDLEPRGWRFPGSPLVFRF